ncbi:deoxyribonuclease V [Endothiovibrio diazotrophicus]
MKLRHSHSWDLTPSAAIALQRELAGYVELEDRFDPPGLIAGVDVGFEARGAVTRAAVAVLDAATLELVEYAIARLPTTFPYVPGLLSFREVPAVLAALDRLERCPGMLLCDGQGRAHPRRFGIACHLGVLTGLPTVGVAKSRLVGRHPEPPVARGGWVPLTDGEETIGAVLRTRVGVKPLYVSSGHRVALSTAVARVMAATTRYRLPETTRWADRLASHGEPYLHKKQGFCRSSAE